MISNGELTMRLKKVCIICSLFLGMLLFSQTVLPEVKKEKVVSFSGFIESVAGNEKYVVVNEGKVFLAATKVVDEKGRVIGTSELKPRVYVRVDGTQRTNGFDAIKITILKTPNVLRSKIKRP